MSFRTLKRHLLQRREDGVAGTAHLEAGGFIDAQGKLTTGTKPFNVFARIASGELDAASFLEVIKTGKPVIISEVTQSWPASTEWTDEYLREKAGDIVIDVEAGNDKYFHAPWEEKARTMMQPRRRSR